MDRTTGIIGFVVFFVILFLVGICCDRLSAPDDPILAAHRDDPSVRATVPIKYIEGGVMQVLTRDGGIVVIKDIKKGDK